ncbi:hypothetical protein NIES2107_32030 [Nostoc carneum NIES-2107]|nr:hypothetical protein NIES2107_32030 [Nostoc carneum NIES-2107]
MRLAKIFAFVLSFVMLFFSAPVMADTITAPTLRIIEKAAITGGKLSVNTTTTSLPATTVIRSAQLLLPAGETGTINKIQISGPNGLEFGCQNIKVQDGVNLIKACGGPAVLQAGGSITYIAEGSGFTPEENTNITVVLSDEF